MQKPSNGRIVHFVHRNYHFGAVVVGFDGEDRVDLFVFPSAVEVVPGALNHNRNAFSVPYDATASKDWSWHWPERVE